MNCDLTFVVSDTHVKRERGKLLLWGSFFAALTASAVSVLVRADKWSAMLLPAVMVFFLGQMLWTVIKRANEGRKSFPTVAVYETSNVLTVNRDELTVTMSLNQIKKLSLQYQKSQLQSIVAETTSGQVMRFEGYDDRDALAAVFQRHVPADRIKHARVYHH